MEKRQRGRPRKEKDIIEFWQFCRVGILLAHFDEVRKKGEKHSVAVSEAADSFRLSNPEVPVSLTAVKRILATFRPSGSRTVLLFERSNLTEADVKRHRWNREILAAQQKEKGAELQVPRVYDETHRGVKFRIRFSERPDYPRCNGKTPTE